ncbi:uncharacterized protein STEHIDRAFT_108230 [Stereum hirsutum FP-91666 SS1]|uniref:uncharacterized protein n=1 Tax=Stereum hirsutum (strain FP-91666) TaxID=721885 RepID=UPI000440A0D2|nr:uncharacterized protein STEHIDRAFT_108230 [Stereum hirsutum FP-91666 SS1]EIM89508.1 hypothetical protein STEHIDRAFT_108230 [Stereum hirsutum FP-91666 SS1]
MNYTDDSSGGVSSTPFIVSTLLYGMQNSSLSTRLSTELSRVTGAYIGLALPCTGILIHQSANSRTPKVFLFIHIFMFSVATSWWALTFAIYQGMLETASGRADSLGTSITTRINVVRQYLPLANYLVHDFVVVWRVWSLSARRVRIGIVVVGMTTIVVLISLIVASISAADVWPDALHYWMDATPAGYLAEVAFGMTLFTNIWATAMIALKAWSHRKLIYSTEKRWKTRTTTLIQGVMLLLVESGALYCAIWVRLPLHPLLPLSNSIMGPRGLTLASLERANTSNMYPQLRDEVEHSGLLTFLASLHLSMVLIAGIYPTTIIVLIRLQKTYRDCSPSIPSTFVTLEADSSSHHASDLPTIPPSISTAAS